MSLLHKFKELPKSIQLYIVISVIRTIASYAIGLPNLYNKQNANSTYLMVGLLSGVVFEVLIIINVIQKSKFVRMIVLVISYLAMAESLFPYRVDFITILFSIFSIWAFTNAESKVAFGVPCKH